MQDSDLVKEIKSFNILTEDDICVKNGWIHVGGSCGIDDKFQIDFWYKYAYQKKRDQITIDNLKNDCIIEFTMDTGKEVPVFNYDTFINKLYNDELSDEDSECILYEEFVKTMTVGKLVYDNEIILKCSYINVHFKYPMRQTDVTFKMMADNEMNGFTLNELALKVMQKYHMLVFMWQNYDLKQGIINPGVHNCFQPFMYECDWLMNGVTGLQYDKPTNTWEVLLIDYH